MVQPLTKRNKNGELYQRPAEIEAHIEAVSGLSLEALKARLSITKRTSADYLPSECLVHLIRLSMRDNDRARTNAVIAVLFNRCEAILKVKVPDGEFDNAAWIREEVLGQFSDLFALDGSAPDADDLDFYECRFHSAFKALRVDIIRAEQKRLERFETMPAEPEEDDAEADGDPVLRSKIAKAFQTQPTQHDAVVLDDLYAAIRALPAEEARAVMLVHVMGLKEESNDSEEETAATICGCTGRTIRNRLASAAKKLKHLKEDL